VILYIRTLTFENLCQYKAPKATGEIQSKCFCTNPKGGELVGDQARILKSTVYSAFI
jgi:hypothetical protein